jgi:hypothetical protein
LRQLVHLSVMCSWITNATGSSFADDGEYLPLLVRLARPLAEIGGNRAPNKSPQISMC